MATLEILSLKNSHDISLAIERIINLDDLITTRKNYVKYDKICFEYPTEKHSYVLEHLSNSICAFVKFRILNTLLKDIKLDIYDKYALLGALLSIDKENDAKTIIKTIFNLKIICIESLLDLRLSHLQANWEQLGELAKSLLMNITTKAELYELITYFISNFDKCTRLVITDGTPPKMVVDGTTILPFFFTTSNDYNLLVSVMRESPTNIVIKNQELLSPKLLETFRALGQ